jgi:hypothetical protein
MKSAVRAEYEKHKDLFVPYLSWKYPSCWWKNIRWFFRSFGLAFQRARRGYSCTYDIMDLNDYFVGALACALEDFTEYNIGIPQSYLDAANGDEDKAIGQWHNDIKKVSLLLFQSLESLEDFNYDVPECPEVITFKNNKVEFIGGTEEEKQNWLTKTEEIALDRIKCRKEAFEWLNEYWEHLWI